MYFDTDRVTSVMRCNVLIQQIELTARERLQCSLFRFNVCALCLWHCSRISIVFSTFAFESRVRIVLQHLFYLFMITALSSTLLLF